MRRSSFFWGSILVLGGILLLLDNLGWIAVSVWGLFWSLFLIVLGAWVLWGNVLGRRPVATEAVVIPLEGASRAKVRFQHGAGRLNVSAGETTVNLLEGTFAGGLNFDTRREGELLDVRVRVPTRFFPGLWFPGDGFVWSFGINRQVTLALDFEMGANEAKIDLTDLRVTDLRLKSGANAADVTLPANAGFTRVSIETGASSISLHMPAGVAARIRTEGGLSSISVDRSRFPRVGGVYLSPDYETAANKAEISVQVGVGSVSIS